VAGARVHPIPTGEQFVFARWTEITSADAPWWTRPSGIGIRLCLTELVDLAEARSTGGIAKPAITRLINEARRTLLGSNSYLSRRYKAVVDDMNHSLRDDSAENWVPEALGPSTMAAARKLIDTPDYISTLVGDIAVDASKVTHVASSVDAVEALTHLESLVELLDAELMHDGHSVAWRCYLVEHAKRLHHEGGQELGEAIRNALEDNRHAESRQFDILVPVAEFDSPPGGRAGLFGLDPNETIRDIIVPWEAVGLEAVLADGELIGAAALIRYEPTAVDVHAAARDTSQDFERDADLWRLRGGTISSGKVAFVYDPAAVEVYVVALPAEPLDLLPQKLGNYEARAGGSDRATSRVDDALLQLARARTASPTTALISLWTAAEALFAGAVGDVRGDAAPVMAALAEFLYLRDLFAWLGDRYSEAGFVGSPGPGSSRWGFDRTLERTTEVLDRLADCDDVLAWWRLKTITRWKKGRAFREQLAAFSARMEQVAARAYLIRNMALHRAEARERALAVTLSPFAGLVRECVGYVASEAAPGAPLSTAKAAALAARHAANKVEAGTAEAPEAIRALLAGSQSPRSEHRAGWTTLRGGEATVIEDQATTETTTVAIEDVAEADLDGIV
jgi:hypothetical protein